MSKENRQRQLSIKDELTEFLLYRSPNRDVKVEVLLYDETIWLPQKQIAELFGVGIPAVSKHLTNIFESGELVENSVVSVLETTATDGKNYQTKYYNLDVIISVGYRVKSKQGPQFRIWAERILAKNEGQVLSPKVLSSNEIASKIYDVRGCRLC